MIDMAIAEQQIWDKLRECNDPELPCNIVDLGLVYKVGQEVDRVRVTMTLTSPQCPMTAQIVEKVRHKLLEIPGVAAAEVELVFDPPWSFSLVSPGVRQQLGLR